MIFAMAPTQVFICLQARENPEPREQPRTPDELTLNIFQYKNTIMMQGI
jgi:hypothetical protein